VSIESLFSSKVPWVTRLGGVASEHITASRLGVEVIRMGGNAVDAAVATSLTLAVTQPHLGGLGSDLVALIYTASDGKVHFLNATGWAPAKMSRSLGKVPLRGPLSIVVPGMLAGLYSMWRRFGELEWRRLISMVIDGVGGGFPIGPSLVRAISNVLNDADDAFKSTYPINAKPWDLVKIPKLINALRLIGENGPDAFYRGDIGESIVNHVNSLGGVLSMSDLRDYEPEWGDPICVEYRGLTVCETPPNTQGLTTLMILRLIENEPKAPGPFSPSRINTYLKAYEAAYSARDEFIGDPRFVKIPVDRLLDPEFLKGRLGGPRGGGGDTTYFVVADPEGNVVSAIQSLYYHFGSLVTEPKYGITLNNRAADFSMSGVNEVAPRKRPLHTLSTMMVMRNGELELALGTSGAHYRPQQHVLMLTNIVDYGMNPVNAVNAPRFLWGIDGLIIEEGFEVTGLSVRHRLIKYPGSTGVASILANINGVKILYSDVRGDGAALGL